MNKLKQILTDRKFWFSMLISILFFGTFAKMEYATDTYAVLENSATEMFKHFLTAGRFVTAIAYGIIKILHIGEKTAYTLSFILAVICTSLSVYKLDKIFSKEINAKWMSMLASILIVINIFSIELYLFIEKGILMLSVLFCILAFEKLIEYFEGERKKILPVFVYMIFANFSYQGTVALFVTLSLIYIIKYTKDIKSFIKNNIITALCYGIPAVINYGIVKFIFHNSRVSSENNLWVSINKIISDTKYMVTTTYDIIPKYLFLTILIFIATIIVIGVTKQYKDKRQKSWLLFGMFYVLIGNLITTIFPQIMQSTASIWFVPRSTYAFASLIGILLVYLFMNVNVNERLQKILIIVLIVYMSVQYIGFQNIIRDRYILNYMDFSYCKQIEDKIQNYEKENEQKVIKVAFYQNNEMQYSYPNIYSNRDTNIRAMYPAWSRMDAINYYLDRDFEETEGKEEVFKKYFENRKWKNYSDEQIVLIGDTMHIFIY